MHILNLETALLNLDQVAGIREIKANEKTTTVEVVFTSGEISHVDLPEGKRLKDFKAYVC